MDLVYAILLAVLPPREDVVVKPLPLVIQPGTVETIPDPLPYVLSAFEWGPEQR